MTIGAGVGGVIVGGGNLATQLATNGWNMRKVNWGVVGVNALSGAASGA